jgi:hypothetical protein
MWTDISEVYTASETSVHFNETTWRYIPEDSKLHKNFDLLEMRRIYL